MSEDRVDDRTVEATGETVGEARWSALHQLERRFPALDREAVEFRVLAEGERGLLGIGYEPARVIATYAGPADGGGMAPAPVHAAGSATGRVAAEVVGRVVAAIGIDAHPRVQESADRVVVSVEGDDVGLLIGKHGATIDALQYLANAIVHRHVEEPAEVVVDAQGYRARRERTLADIAERAAQRVRDTGETVDLEPMIAGERKVVHLRLKDVADVRTESDGREPNRFVRVLPA